MSRSKITVVNGSINRKEVIDTDASTWGGLKSELESMGLVQGDVRGVVKETSSTLDLDSAQIPEGESTVYVVPKKSKAGGEDYSSWSFAQLRAECASRDSIEGNSGNYGSTEVMIAKLEADDAAKTSDNTNVELEDFVDMIADAVVARLQRADIAVSADNAEDDIEEEVENGLDDEDYEFYSQIERNL